MKASFATWLATVTYALVATYLVDSYWKHNGLMQAVMFTPLAVIALSILFEDQIWKIRHLIADRRALRSPPVEEDWVTVHLPANDLASETRDRGEIYRLQEDLREVLKKDKLGTFDGNEIGEDEAVLFLSGRDGEAIFRAIEPVLRASPLCQGGSVRISRFPPGSFEREVKFE